MWTPRSSTTSAWAAPPSSPPTDGPGPRRMSTETLKFNEDGLHAWTEEREFEVTRERLAQYAKATNDPIGAHLEGEVAPPVFAIVPVFQSLVEPALQVVPASVLGNVLHGEQDFRFHRAL